MFCFFEAFFVLVLQLDKVFDKVFDFLMFFVVDKFKMIDFSLFDFEIISDSGVFVFI